MLRVQLARTVDAFPSPSQPAPSDLLQAEELWEQLLAWCPPSHRDVLRLKPPALVEVFDDAGNVGVGTLGNVDGATVTVIVVDVEAAPQRSLSLRIASAIVTPSPSVRRRSSSPNRPATEREPR